MLLTLSSDLMYHSVYSICPFSVRSLFKISDAWTKGMMWLKHSIPPKQTGNWIHKQWYWVKSESERMGEKRMEVCVPHFYYSDVTITLYSEYSKGVGLGWRVKVKEWKRREWRFVSLTFITLMYIILVSCLYFLPNVLIVRRVYG